MGDNRNWRGPIGGMSGAAARTGMKNNNNKKSSHRK